MIAFGERLARVEVDVEDSRRRRGARPDRRTLLCSIERGDERRHLVDG